jgi:hypothetical protein
LNVTERAVNAAGRRRPVALVVVDGALGGGKYLMVSYWNDRLALVAVAGQSKASAPDKRTLVRDADAALTELERQFADYKGGLEERVSPSEAGLASLRELVEYVKGRLRR